MTTPSAEYVYICSSGHSGSTLLEMFLAGHSDVAGVGELHNLSFQIAHDRVCSCGVAARECSYWQAVADAIRQRCRIDIFTNPYAFVISRERPRHWLEHGLRLWNRAFTYASFRHRGLARLGLQRLILGYETIGRNRAFLTEIIRERTGARVLVDSSKDYVLMREMYDRAAAGGVKVIYLFRDGRGCLWSSLKRGDVSVRVAATQWAKNQRRTQVMLRGVRPDDRIDVRYEELCAEPERTLRHVCDRLGLAFQASMLELAPADHHTIAGNRIRVQRRLAVRVDEAWRAKLTAMQLDEFDRHAGVENRRLGYTDAAIASDPRGLPGSDAAAAPRIRTPEQVA